MVVLRLLLLFCFAGLFFTVIVILCTYKFIRQHGAHARGHVSDALGARGR